MDFYHEIISNVLYRDITSIYQSGLYEFVTTDNPFLNCNTNSPLNITRYFTGYFYYKVVLKSSWMTKIRFFFYSDAQLIWQDCVK